MSSLPYLGLIFLNFLFQSCVFDSAAKKDIGICDYGYTFNPDSRKCVFSRFPPLPTLETINMVENVASTLTLTYRDNQNDLASGCAISSLSSTLDQTSLCVCVGGICKVTLTPQANFSGLAQFAYNLTDKDGSSAFQLVRVNVAHIDTAPSILDTTPTSTIVLAENTTQSIQLNYTDVDGDKASQCEVSIADTSLAYSSRPCSCDRLGVCSFTLAGKTNVFNAPLTSNFSYKVFANGQWSGWGTANYSITWVNQDPIPGAVTPLGGTVNENFVNQVFLLSYTEGDGHKPASCSLGTVNQGFTFVSCDCATPAFGTCYLTLSTDPAYTNYNSTIATFQFSYQLADADSADVVESGINVINVLPVNQNPVVEVPIVSPQAGFENTPITITGYQVGEGGAWDEYAQSLSIKLTSTDSTTVKDSKIIVSYNGNILGTGGSYLSVGDGASAANLHTFTFDVTPESNRTGNVIINISIMDSLGGVTTDSFTINFAVVTQDPTVKKTTYRCNYDKYVNAPGCDAPFSSDDYHRPCVNYRSPVTEGIVPDQLGEIFYDFVANACYFSTGTALGNWQSFTTTCNITKSAQETSCQSLPGSPLNCIGSGAPSVAPVAPGSFYYDYTNKICYTSNYIGSVSGWGAVPTTDQTSYCPFNQSGTTTPLNLVTPTSKSSIYQNTTNGKCYYASGTTAASWVQINTQCPFSNQTAEKNCTTLNCIGTAWPRNNTSVPANDIIPSAINNYYYKYDSNICFQSVGTSSGKDWVIWGDEIPDVKSNEGSRAILSGLVYDEGGDSSQDAQTLTIKVKKLTTSSATLYNGNPEVLNSSNIFLYKNGVSVAGAGPVAEEMTFPLGDGALDAQLQNVEFDFVTTPGEYGRVEMLMTISNGIKSVQKYFSILAYPIAGQHNGWTEVIVRGDKVNKFGQFLEDRKVQLGWKDFSVTAGTDSQTPRLSTSTTDYTGATVSGYHIFRRMAGQKYDWTKPLNGISTPISVNVKEFIDTKGVTAEVPGPTESDPSAGKVYYYTVKGIDSINNQLMDTNEVFSEIRVTVPPQNMTFVHRWMANKDMCTKMNATPIAEENFRCLYSGPGENIPTGASGDPSYFDIGKDLLVDSYEAGCPYSSMEETGTTNCTNGECIGVGAPTSIASTSPIVFYSRSTGTCYLNIYNPASSWSEVNNLPLVDTLDTNYTNMKTFAKRTRLANLPPLTNLTQEVANTLCYRRDTTTIYNQIDSTVTVKSGISRLPSRVEQVAYSSWKDTTDTFTDLDNIIVLERGLSLNSQSRCNTSNADGLASYYSDSNVPPSGAMFSLPGTASSNIRSLITGSTTTQDCVSRYGIQDTIGNVSEWASDRIYCSDSTTCRSVNYKKLTFPQETGKICKYTLNSESTLCGANSDCIGTTDPTGNITVTTKGLVYYNVATDRCWVALDTAGTWAAMDTFCSTTNSEVETGCTSSLSCIFSVTAVPPGVSPITPTAIGNFIFDYKGLRCYETIKNPNAATPPYALNAIGYTPCNIENNLNLCSTVGGGTLCAFNYAVANDPNANSLGGHDTASDGAFMLDTRHNLCWVYDLSGPIWRPISVYSRCDVTSSAVETSCQALGASRVNCVGDDTPTNKNLVPTRIGSRYWDWTNKKCWQSSGIKSNTDWTDVSENYLHNNFCNKNNNASYATIADIYNGVSGYGVTVSTADTLTYDSTNNVCYASTTTAPAVGNVRDYVARSVPPKVPPALNFNNDMRVDDTFFYNWVMDGVRGPCSTTVGFRCGAALTSWDLSAPQLDASRFIPAVGLPAFTSFNSQYPSSKVVDSLLLFNQAGSNGFDSDKVHNDFIRINSSTIVSEDVYSHCGAMNTGGSYTYGNNAGNFSLDFKPCNDTNTATTPDSSRSSEVGFRCVTPIDYSLYIE